MDIKDRLIGANDLDKNLNLIFINHLLRAIAYPRRGTEEELYTIEDIANKIFGFFDGEELLQLRSEYGYE